FAGADDVDDRDVSRVEIQDRRRSNALGQNVSDRAADRGQLRNGKCGARVLFEIDLDEPDAVKGVGLYVVNASDGLGGSPLGDVDDALFDFGRRRSWVIPRRVDFGDVD